MSAIVNRIAKIIDPAAWDGYKRSGLCLVPDDYLRVASHRDWGERVKDSKRKARLILESLRRPTRTMSYRGFHKVFDCARFDDGHVVENAGTQIWQAMLDAAL